MLLLDNETIERLLPMEEFLPVLEEAFRDVIRQAALAGIRTDALVPGPQERSAYQIKSYSSILPSRSVGCVRIASDIMKWVGPPEASQRKELPLAPGNRWTGLLLLFSAETGEPLAIFPDAELSRVRVGATSALAARYLARPDAGEVAILGAGWQAGTQARAICAVRPVRRVRVFSRSSERREAFSLEWSRKLELPFEPVDSARAAVEGAEIVLCATDAMQPVLEAEWLSPGAHVGAIRQNELGPDLFARADLAFVFHKGETSAKALLPSVDNEDVRVDHGWGQEKKRAQMPTLFDLLTGNAAGRTDSNQVSCFVNNGGMGVQFVAVGWLAWKKAREQGIGRELPTEWFTQAY